MLRMVMDFQLVVSFSRVQCPFKSSRDEICNWVLTQGVDSVEALSVGGDGSVVMTP